MSFDRIAEVLTDDERLQAASAFVQHVAQENNDDVELFEVTPEHFVYRLGRDYVCREQRFADIPLSHWRARAAHWRESVLAPSHEFVLVQ